MKISFQWTLFLTIMALTIFTNVVGFRPQQRPDAKDNYVAPAVDSATVPADLNILTVDLRDYNLLPNNNSILSHAARSNYIQSYNSIASQIVPADLSRCNLPRSLN